jgi:hypothetical protein
VKLKWEDAGCASSYNVVVRKGAVNGKQVYEEKKLKATEDLTTTLQKGQTYYWRVTAKNKNGKSNSEWWSFTVK